MSLFLLTFILIYGGLHAYGLWKLQSAFSPGSRTMLPLVFLAVFLILSPLFTRVSERAGHESTALVLAHIGYPWMGFLFLFFVFSLLLDLGRFLNYFFPSPGGNPGTWFFLKGPVPFFLAFGAALLVSLHGVLEARHIQIERISIETEKLPPGTPNLKIIQISDVHLGLLVGKRHIQQIVGIVREERPDILISTGDFVDGTLYRLPGLAESIRDLPAPFGKFAVTGNHEVYAGLPESLRFIEKAGFRILRDEAVLLPGLMNIVGIDDPAAHRSEEAMGKREGTLLPDNGDLFTLLLKHRPLIRIRSPEAGRFDLQLSGHTHRGQIFPFTLLTALAYPYQSGTYTLAGGSLLHVSRGTGTWGPPMRVLSPPEVTVIELKRPKRASGRG